MQIKKKSVAWQQLSMADVPLPLGSQIVPSLSYQLLTFHDCNSQLAQQQLRVRVILQLAVYCQSVPLGTKPLETHKQYIFFSTEHLQL
jgi:hypothetical protein